MAIQTEDGITSPSGNDEQKLVQDLAAMATTIQEALNKRANTYRGTSAQRTQFTSQAEEGQLWKDTNGSKILWAKQGTGWTRVWPENRESGVFIIGSRTQEFSTTGQLQLRRYFSSNNSHGHVNLLVPSNQDFGLQFALWKNSTAMADFRFGYNGQIEFGAQQEGTRVSRFLPFSTLSGYSTLTPSGTNQTTSRSITFKPGRFTQAPVVIVTPTTTVPQNVDIGVSAISTSGFTINMYRTSSVATSVNWLAMQRVAQGVDD